MNHLLTKLLILLLIASKTYGQDASVVSITPDELSSLAGEWEGKLTYLDYQTSQPFTMPMNMVVKLGDNPDQLEISNIYPNEPKANSTDSWTISKGGKEFNGKPVISKKTLKDGRVEVMTEYQGKDDNQKAQIRETYLFGKMKLSTRKEVQFKKNAEWILKNESEFQKK